jgi:hypothetical protein
MKESRLLGVVCAHLLTFLSRLRLIWGLLIVTLAHAPAGQAATLTLLGSGQSGRLFSINTTTGAGTLIGISPIASTEIEFGEDTLYSEGANGDSNLYTIDPSNAAVTGTIPHPCCALNGLEFVGNTLYGTRIIEPRGPSTLEIVNTTTGAFTTVGPTGLGPIPGLAYETSTNTMWGVTGRSPQSSLVTIDLATGLATLGQGLFDTSTGAPIPFIGSIEFLNGVLYAGDVQTGDIDKIGGFYSVNTVTGGATYIGNTGFRISGLTAIPIPAAAWLFGSGLLGLVGIARRKKAA